MVRRATTAPSTTTGRWAMRPTARIPASGGLMIAVNSSMSNMPRLETLNVAPVYSSGASRRARARSARAFDSAVISSRPFRSAFRMTGVMSPSSIATAIPMWTSA